ncbi:MAG: cadmium-translocating P-type ATPase [Lachnospiraceae bacterium]|nr:cadmium-translocating P-type ATPase [Lachnospiraceae bacterium]
MKDSTQFLEQEPEMCGCGGHHAQEHGHSHEAHEHSHFHEAQERAHSHETHEHSHSECQEEDCGCGHVHGHGCHHKDHEHEHKHSHDVSGCGEEGCGCGHSHDHSPEYQRTEGVKKPKGQGRKYVYILENLGCAHCAAKMEEKIGNLPGVISATITYATKQLRIEAKDPEGLVPQIEKICLSIEPDVKVIYKSGRKEDVQKKIRNGEVRETAGSTEKSRMEDENRREETKTLASLLSGAVCFILGIILEHVGVDTMVTIPVYVLSYGLLGAKILWTAVRNLTKGHVFDENFLMSIATLGAFVIGDYPEAAGVMLFYRIGEFFEEKAVAKSRSQIMEAVDLRPEVVNLETSEGILVIGAKEAAVGDILLVRPGDRIPLDGTIVEGESRIDTSPITGEPVPVLRKTGDYVVSGCVNTSGQLKIRVEKILEESMVTRILDSVENAAASKPQIDRFITRFAKIYTPVVVAVALATAIIPSVITGDWDYWVYTALSFLVMSCPCALVLSVPLAFFSGIGAGSREGILFKGGVSIEAMSKIKAVIMDKTGTITEGNFLVQKISPTKAGAVEATELLKICAGCEQHSTHPIAVSIVAKAKEEELTLSEPEQMEEIAGHGIRAVLDGKEILCGNRTLMDKFGIAVETEENGTFGSEVYVALDGVSIGQILVSDTIKADAKESIAGLKKMNVATAMLTGDRKESADAVAGEIGLDEVRAKLLPEEKVSELKELRKKYGPVMYVGDGINDAPVLAGADVGAAMGSGADAALEAADVVFMTSGMSAIPQSVQIARSTRRISWQNVGFALLIKAIVMIFGLCGFASMWAAVFADTGVAMLCVLNSVRILYRRPTRVNTL